MADYTLSAKITGESSGFEKAFSAAQKAAENFDKNVSQSMKGASQQIGKSLSEIAAESGKTVNQLRSDIMKSAAEYKRAGMTQSEAMRQAYADIGYSAGSAADKSETALGKTENKLSSVAKKVKSVGDSFKELGKKISSVGDSLTSKITKPALAAGTALAGITLAKGWNRLVGIDDARAKLQGLGHDAETIETIMDSALSSVQGTAFGLDEAATTAANAVAAGIEPGKELNEYLTMIADAASIAGISMSEMGSIINKVQTGQTVYTEDLEQLADRGLPVYQWLAEEAGVAASEVKQLASDGQISSQMLYDAIEKNIGGAAQIMGETSFSAALDNIGASISRIGANFLDAGGEGGGFFSQLKPLMADFSDSLGTLEEKAAELGAKFGQAFADAVQKIKDLKAQFDALPESVQETILKVGGIGSAVAVGTGPALKIFGSLTSGLGSFGGLIGGTIGKVSDLSGKISKLGGASGALSAVFGALTSPVGIAVAAFAALAVGFAYLMTTNDDFRNSIMQTLGVLGESFQTVLAALLPVITQLATLLGETIASVLQQLAPVIAQYVTMIAELWAQLAPMIAQLITELAPVITLIIENVSQIISTLLPPLISVIQAIMDAIKALMPVIMDILSVAIDVISSIIKAVTPIVAFVGDIISDIVAVITPIISKIANIISQVAAKIKPIASTVSGVFNNIFSTVSGIMSKVGSVVTNVFSSIKSAWSGLTGFVSGVFDGIGSAVESLVNQVKGFINGVIGGINAAIGLINKLPNVEISKIPELAHGTDNWQGGFAVMNEGGRGELTYLPNGAQVIPHDISVKYAKEAARTNRGAESLDLSGLMEGMVIQVINNTSVDGTPLRESISDYTIRKIGNQQKAVLKSKGAFA